MSGLGRFCWKTAFPGLYLPMLARRAEALAKAGAQIFSQTACRAEVKRRRSEGGFKSVAVLPIREIGDVIFADFFRQFKTVET